MQGERGTNFQIEAALPTSYVKRRAFDERAASYAQLFRHSSCCAFTFARACTRVSFRLLSVTARASFRLFGVAVRASLRLLVISIGVGSNRAAIVIMVGLIEAMPFEDDTSGEENATNLRSTFWAGS